jgi:hypothetical protein
VVPPLVRTSPLIPPGNKAAQNAMPAAPRVVSPQITNSVKQDIYTYLTDSSDEQTLYTGDQEWTTLTLTLETAGPVAVSTRQGIRPVLSGKGILLPTGVPMTFQLSKGNKLYIAATGVNRVKVMVEQTAWAQQILGAVIGGAR